MKGGTDTPTMGASQADGLPPRARNGFGPVFGRASCVRPTVEADSLPRDETDAMR